MSSTRQDNTCTIPINLGEELDFLLSSTLSKQIDAPHRIEAALLQPFLAGVKKMRLIDPRRQTSCPATLHVLGDDCLIADTEVTTAFSKQGDRLLVVFPVSPHQHYVLQTLIDEVYVNRVKVRFLGYPRADARRHVQLAAPVSTRLAPSVIITAIQHQEVRIMREIALPPRGLHGGGDGAITDRLYEPGSSELSALMRSLEDSPPFSCGLKDITCGGVCLTLEGAHQPEQFLSHVILMHIPFPRITVPRTNERTMALRLHPLGVIRDVGATTQPWTLHVRFVQRLPKELAPHFELLERCFLESQRPLA